MSSPVRDLLATLRLEPGIYSFGLFHIVATPARLLTYPPGDGFMIIPAFLTETFSETEFNYWEARMAAGCLRIEFSLDQFRVVPQRFQLQNLDLVDIYLVLRIYYDLGFQTNEQVFQHEQLGINEQQITCANGSLIYLETFEQRGTMKPMSKIIIEKQVNGQIMKTSVNPNREYDIFPELRIPNQN